jgi:outer membrane murein-binding lipoprotein Lpp
MLVVLGCVDSAEIMQLHTELEDLKAAHAHQVDKLEAREVELQ